MRRMISQKVEVSGGTEADDCSNEKEGQEDTIFGAIAGAELVVQGESKGEEPKGPEQVTIHIHGLVMEIAKTGDGFPVAAGDGSVMAEDIFVVLLPWLNAIPVL